jgi:hypothetical protein
VLRCGDVVIIVVVCGCSMKVICLFHTKHQKINIHKCKHEQSKNKQTHINTNKRTIKHTNKQQTQTNTQIHIKKTKT